VELERREMGVGVESGGMSVWGVIGGMELAGW